jgi:hypothetical protein
VSDAYDPGAPEGSSPTGSQYISKRDVRAIAVILVVLGVVMIPVYKMLEKNGQKVVCSNNMQAIAGAINQYAEQHDERFPPVFATDPSGTSPLLIGQAKTFTWASEISGYMKTRASFYCPAAEPDEAVTIDSQREIDSNSASDRARKFGEELLSYGMYMAYSGYQVQQVADPNRTILIAETSNMGARGSYDPFPFHAPDGKLVPFDCFAIGWDNSNAGPNKSTKTVTRLAFYEAAKGDFQVNGPSRHNSFIHALTAGGSLLNLDASSALVQQRGDIVGAWSVPPGFGH